MDRDFIARHDIVERYLAGRLPPRGVTDFERFCEANPDLLDEIGLAARVHAGLRLLEAGGKPEPWAEKPQRFWETLPFIVAVSAALVVMAVTALIAGLQLIERNAQIAGLEKRVAEQPLLPATSTRAIRIVPSRTGPTASAVAIGGGSTQFADLKIDVSWSKFSLFRVTIDRRDQGRVTILHNVARDSNGDVRLGLNSSALGPGDYAVTLDGLTWRREPVAQAWTTLSIQR